MSDFTREQIRSLVLGVLSGMGMKVGPRTKSKKTDPKRPEGGPRTLILFNAGVRKLGQALEQIHLIEENFGRISVYTGASARAWVCSTDVKEQAGARCILDTVTADGMERALSHADILVLPTLCLNSAAKVAHLIRDDEESRIISSALFKGKKILAARDGFTVLEDLANEAVREEIEKILRKLQDLGMVFSDTEQLYATFKTIAASLDKGNPPGTAGRSSNLITAKDVVECKQRGERMIHVAKKSMITSLAVDLAKEYGIKVVRTP